MNNSIRNGFDPAFPGRYENSDGTYAFVSGVTKREYIAIQMLPTIMGVHSDDTTEEHCVTAIKYADELLKQLDEPQINIDF